MLSYFRRAAIVGVSFALLTGAACAKDSDSKASTKDETSSESSTVLNVPKDYKTIQAAVDASEEGSLILIDEGTYKEAVDVAGKPNITIRGVDRNKVILDAPVASNNFHPFFPNADGSVFDVVGVSLNIRRWTFDLDSKDTGWKEEVLFGGLRGTSMVRMDDRYLTRPFRWSYMLVVDPTLPFDRERGGKLSVRVANSIFRFDHHTGAIDRLSAGNTHSLSEPQFVPARPDAPEGEGYILTVANDYSEMRSELVIADAMRLGDGPIARVKLPFRLHTQVHGWWEPQEGFLTGFRPR